MAPTMDDMVSRLEEIEQHGQALGRGEWRIAPNDRRYQVLTLSVRGFGNAVAVACTGSLHEGGVSREVALCEFAPMDYRNPFAVGQKLARLRLIIKLAGLTNAEPGYSL